VLPASDTTTNPADHLPRLTEAAANPPPPIENLAASNPPPSAAFSLTVNSAAARPPSSLPLSPVDVRDQDWPRQLGERIHWQLGAGVQEARIELAPEGLGPLELRVQVEAGQVQLHIGAAHAATRELLGEALPRLRELLGDSGLSLGQASVSSQQERTPPPMPLRTASSTAPPEPEEPPIRMPLRRARGLLDHYA